MKVIFFSVNGINGKNSTHNLVMNDDINIITGRNGAGKTSTLKLLWLLLSGNIRQAILECAFNSVQLVTSDYSLIIFRNIEGKISQIYFKNENESEEYDEKQFSQESLFEEEERLGVWSAVVNKKRFPSHELNIDHRKVILQNRSSEKLLKTIGSISDKINCIGESIYFPTFRRIEGGFSLGENKNRASISSDLEDAMSSLSKKFSRGKHLFVSSLSMTDVSQFLLKEYSNLNDISANQTNLLSQQVIMMIKNNRGSKNNLKKANVLLDDILEKIEEIENNRNELMRPLAAVQKVVSTIFKHKGINFGENLNFGDAAAAVNSDKLSAGEKQLLSFICYNAFFDNAIFIIDEPELSLHVDWQRKFFKILLDQNPKNQFIVSTHSPFIYGKYPDKEVLLNEDRGDGDTE